MTDKKEHRAVIARLPFGQERAFISNDVQDFTDQASSVMEGLREYDARGDKKDFCYASSQININELQIIASSSTPVSFRVTDSATECIYAVFPTYGKADASVTGSSRILRMENAGFISPDIERSGLTTSIAMSQVILDVHRLEETVTVMFGDEAARRIRACLQVPNIVPYRLSGVRYDHIFAGLYRLIDELRVCGESLRRMAFDDQFYRIISMMLVSLKPDSMFLQAPGGNIAAGSTDIVCEYMRANYQHPISLTVLEQMSRVGARSLQLSFQKEWGCSPMEWLKRLRLDLAHQRLKSPKEQDSVTVIALDCGFTRLSGFSQAYAHRYGETPSMTLARSR